MKRSELRREILFELSDVARALRTYIDQRARAHGMTRAQWSVLSRIQRQEGMNQAELAEVLEIQPISLVRLIDRLCGQGLVERRAHATDRRVNLLHLTPAGRDRLHDMGPLGREISLEAMDGLGESDVAALLDKLLRVKANIKTASAKHGAASANGSGRHAEIR
jgi:DNA-binding MarR family transcriptional regulator